MTPHEERRLAMRWALVKFVTAIQQRDAEDRANACAENGWRMSDQSDLYTQAISTLEGLATGRVDASAYLDSERLEALNG